jgi:hypothetical protein
VGEGRSAELMVAPGQGRGLSFRVAAAGRVGLGLAAQPERVDLRLYDAQGRLVGSGPLQLHELQPGPYYALITVPADASPARATLTLRGLTPPGSDPPESVRRSYLPAGGR